MTTNVDFTERSARHGLSSTYHPPEGTPVAVEEFQCPDGPMAVRLLRRGDRPTLTVDPRARRLEQAVVLLRREREAAEEHVDLLETTCQAHIVVIEDLEGELKAIASAVGFQGTTGTLSDGGIITAVQELVDELVEHRTTMDRIQLHLGHTLDRRLSLDELDALVKAKVDPPAQPAPKTPAPATPPAPATDPRSKPGRKPKKKRAKGRPAHEDAKKAKALFIEKATLNRPYRVGEIVEMTGFPEPRDSRRRVLTRALEDSPGVEIVGSSGGKRYVLTCRPATPAARPAPAGTTPATTPTAPTAKGREAWKALGGEHPALTALKKLRTTHPGAHPKKKLTGLLNDLGWNGDADGALLVAEEAGLSWMRELGGGRVELVS